jgi:dUTP pyrophosphatase
MIEIKITKQSEDVNLPEYKTKGAAGCDLEAFVEGIKRNGIIARIGAGDRMTIGTGLSIEVPEFNEAQIRPRSGNAAKSGLTVLNTPGTIDSDYRGEIKVILYNSSKEEITIRQGDRIAQIVFAPVLQAQFIMSETISTSTRGLNGLGSTGLNESKVPTEEPTATPIAAPIKRTRAKKVAESPVQ